MPVHVRCVPGKCVLGPVHRIHGVPLCHGNQCYADRAPRRRPGRPHHSVPHRVEGHSQDRHRVLVQHLLIHALAQNLRAAVRRPSLHLMPLRIPEKYWYAAQNSPPRGGTGLENCFGSAQKMVKKPRELLV